MTTQAEYTQLFQRLGAYIQAYRELVKQKELYSEVKPKLWKVIDDSSQVSDLILTGLKKWEDSDSDGYLYGSITATATSYTLTIYNSSARSAGVAICSGTRVGSGAITLTASNSSGVTGSCTLTYSGEDATLQWFANTMYFNYDFLPQETSDKDVSLLRRQADNTALNTAENIQSTLDTAISQALDNIENFIKTVVKDFVNSGETEVSSITTSDDGDGDISSDYAGILKDLIDAMAVNDPVQLVTAPTATLGTLTVAKSGQNGDATTSTKTTQNWIRTGQITLECISELSSTPETFRVSHDKHGEANDVLTFGHTFKSPTIGGIELALARSIEFTDVDSGSTLSAFAISGLKSTNCDTANGGYIYGDIAASGSSYTVNLYSSSARSTTTKVATGTRTGSGAVTLSAYGGSGLSGTCNLTYVGEGNFYIDMNICELNDKFTISTTNNETGHWALIIGRLYNQALATGSATIPDSMCKIAEDYLFVSDEEINV